VLKNLHLKIPLLVLLLAFSGNVHAQFYSLGNDPARIKWMEITAGKCKVIYPQEIDSMARVYAALLESAWQHVQKPLKIESRAIPVVLHPYSVYSNGVVTWAPKRMELITTPPPNSGYSQLWDRQLVIHELRHVAQISKFEEGIFKPLSWLIGEQAAGIGVGLYLDNLTLEGDAVVSETEFSSTGRGRDPSFLMFYKAAFLDGDSRSWQRWKLGSGKRYTPDIYSLGYFIHSHIRSRTENPEYIGELSEYMIGHFYNPWVTKKAYRRVTGNSIKGNFRQLTKEATERWEMEDSAKAPFTQYKVHSEEKKKYVSYKYVIADSPDSLYAVKWDMDEPSKLVLVTPGRKDKRITYIGSLRGSLTEGGRKIYWAEAMPSKRWELESYSVLRCYDKLTGKVKSLTKKGSYNNPALSPGGDTILVTEYPVTGGSKLVLLSAQTSERLSSFPAPENGQLKESVFCLGKIFASAISSEGIALFSLDLSSGKWERETPWHKNSMNRLGRFGETIVFESDLNGTNNIYSYDPRLKYLQRLTNSRFGAFLPYPSGDGLALYYSDYDRNGYKIVSVHKDSLLWEPSSFLKPERYPVADLLSLQSGYSIDSVPVNTELYKPERYRKGSHLFRIHSWAPFYYNLEKIKRMSYNDIYEILSPGITVYSQNTLGTANAMAAYSFSNGRHAGHFNFIYSGFWPVIDFEADYNDRIRWNMRLARDTRGRIYQFITPVAGSPSFASRLLIYMPLNLGGGGWNRGLIPRVTWKHSNDSYYSYQKKRYMDYQYISAGIQYYSMVNPSVLDIFPKLGIGFNLQLNSVPFAGGNYGSLFYANAYGYIPGIMNNHGIKLSVSYQYQNYFEKNYLLPNVASSPRGYENMYGKNYISFSADYAFPVYLGDLEISTLLYIKRLQVIPFADWAYNQGALSGTKMFSAGLDLLLDFNVLNIPLPLSGGLRYARCADRTNHFQILFSLPL
jgi:hypothetical protein